MENNNKSYIKKRESRILYRIIYRKTRMEGEDEGEHAFGGSRLSTICSYTYIYMCVYMRRLESDNEATLIPMSV